jgi:phage terminase large subunit-like protein
MTKPETYIQDVLSGRKTVSKCVRLAIQKHANELEHGLDGFIFDPAQGHRVINFIERFIVGTEGEHAGRPFILEPWSAALLYILYGWRNERTRARRFKFAYCELGRGNLKSTLASALGIYELVSVQGANVYSAATDRATAKVVFDTAVLMVQKSALLSKQIVSQRNNLHILRTGSKFEPCSAEAKTLFAHSRPSFVVLDELHAHPDSSVWDTFSSALGKRRGAWLLAITNSGFDRHSVCWQQRQYSIKVLQGIVPDPTWFSFICGLDEEDIKDPAGWENELNWIKANPSLGHAVSLDDMRSQALKAREDPSALNQFLRFRLSVWTEAHSVWMPLDKWDMCSELVDPEALKGRQCFGGLDLSTTTDISALVLLFPPHGDDKKWRVIPHFFLPKDNVQRRSKRDRVPYDVWERQGLFHLTPGNVIDTQWIRAKVNELAGEYKIVEIAYDKAFSADLTPQLQNDGLVMVPFHPGDFSQTPPLKKLMELVLKQELAHGADPILRWNVSNLVVRIGPTGLMKPDKERSAEKIDGISALLDALGRAMIVPLRADNKVYECFRL